MSFSTKFSTDYLKIYFNKVKVSQNFYNLIEDYNLHFYHKYNEWSIQKNNFIKSILLNEETKKIYFDNEWNYSLPINYEHLFMNENEKEYYKNNYIIRQNIIINFNNSCGSNLYPFNYPEIVANDYLKYKLNDIYQCYTMEQLNSIQFKYYIETYKKWLYTFDKQFAKSLDVLNPDNMEKYMLNREKEYNKKIREKLWSWKLMDDNFNNLVLLMKMKRKRTKLPTKIWMVICTYL